MDHETFAFDPAGNIQVPPAAQREAISHRRPLPKVLDNLLKEYAGTSYRYDERGNLVERVQNAQRDTFEWEGLHYNRHRYYDPSSGRFITNDPVRLLGGINTHVYAPNPTAWTDPLGLTRCRSAAATLERLKGMHIGRIEKTITARGFSKKRTTGRMRLGIMPTGRRFGFKTISTRMEILKRNQA